MQQISTSICIGLGDNIVARILFDTVKFKYSQIKISHEQHLIQMHKNNDPLHISFLRDIGMLLFSDPPFYFDTNQYSPIAPNISKIIRDFSPIMKPDLQHLLCKGYQPNIDEEYICITTKIRFINKSKFLPVAHQFWQALRKLSNKYKIVILGERIFDENVAYVKDLPNNIVYSIYNDIIENIPNERIIDLSIPVYGKIASTITKVQQDGLVMNGSKFVICLGNGGNLWHAIATSNTIIAYRDPDDNDRNADLILQPNFTHTHMHKNWDNFITELMTS